MLQGRCEGLFKELQKREMATVFLSFSENFIQSHAFTQDVMAS